MKKIFSIDTINSKSEAIKKIESKRVLFNVINIIFAITGIIPIYLIYPKIINIFLLPFALFYFIYINIIFTITWIVIIIVKTTWEDINITIGASISLICISCLTAFLTLSLLIFYLILNIP
jgi:hypothetical protein